MAIWRNSSDLSVGSVLSPVECYEDVLYAVFLLYRNTFCGGSASDFVDVKKDREPKRRK